MNQGEGPEVEQAFWGYLGVAPEELPAAKARVRERSFLSGEDEDVDLVLYRVEDLQEELEGKRIYSDFLDLKCSRAPTFLNLIFVCTEWRIYKRS